MTHSNPTTCLLLPLQLLPIIPTILGILCPCKTYPPTSALCCSTPLDAPPHATSISIGLDLWFCLHWSWSMVLSHLAAQAAFLRLSSCQHQWSSWPRKSNKSWMSFCLHALDCLCPGKLAPISVWSDPLRAFFRLCVQCSWCVLQDTEQHFQSS